MTLSQESRAARIPLRLMFTGSCDSRSAPLEAVKKYSLPDVPASQASNFHIAHDPALTRGATLCRRFAPQSAVRHAEARDGSLTYKPASKRRHHGSPGRESGVKRSRIVERRRCGTAIFAQPSILLFIHSSRSRLSRISPPVTPRRFISFALMFASLLIPLDRTRAQVGPAEITNPQLKALEAAYLPQLVSMREEIAKLQFPYPLFLSRYVGLDPKQQAGADARGLEFVLFHDRTVLKTSGNYNAAFDSALLTQNQRASRVLEEVVAPILRLIPGSFTTQADFDRFGFEISYHVRTHSSSYDYEGKEILAVVMDKADAFGYLSAQTEPARQKILNASDIYVNGKEFGLTLHAAQPLGLEELDALRLARDARAKEPAPAARAELVPAISAASVSTVGGGSDARSGSGKPAGQRDAVPTAGGNRPEVLAAPLKNVDAEALQHRLQPELDALGKEGMARYHFVDYAPPSFVVFRNRVHLQMTLRNPNPFDKNTTSIYKRAAQSFDLFLAPLLKSLLDRAPVAEEIAGFDITVLNQFGINSQDSPEALEFIFPLQSLRKFTDAEITNQDLINQGIVLVNGVRIALDLQRVE